MLLPTNWFHKTFDNQQRQEGKENDPDYWFATETS